jgi:general stress protein 26
VTAADDAPGLTWAELSAQLTGMAHVATVTPAGEPHVAAVFPVVDGDELWIFTRRSSRKARNVAANPRMALMWQPGSELYMTGRADLVDDPETKARLWSSGKLPVDPASFFGSPDNPDFVLVRILPERAVVLGPTGRTTWRR